MEMLTVQYRMHEDIMRFSSERFYGGRLVAAPDVASRTVLQYDTPMVWVDTAGCDFDEEVNRWTESKMNRQEAQLLLDVMAVYVDRIGVDRIVDERIDFGIISPYKSQVGLLRRMITRCAFHNRLRKLVTVNSVDGFQGQERDVIILSMVRDNVRCAPCQCGHDEGKSQTYHRGQFRHSRQKQVLRRFVRLYQSRWQGGSCISIYK